uniref:uncharacterized protein n=1 Tax=Myxine glutinosa TaxID=7769 RepID=UPI00358FDEDE
MAALQFTCVFFYLSSLLFILLSMQVKGDSETNMKMAGNVARLVRDISKRGGYLCRGRDGINQMNSKSAFSFFECQKGKAILHYCEQEESFDPGLGTCVPLGNSTMCSDNKYRKIANPDDEKKYFMCRGGKVFAHTCRKGYIFDNLYRSCNVEWFVKLHSSVTTTKPTTAPSFESRCKGKRFSMFADLNDESQKTYYKCFRGKLLGPFKCSSWFVYDRHHNRCTFNY